MNLFEQEPSKLRLAKKRRKATWNDDYRPILPPQIGSFSPLARVVAGFLAFYFFHNVAMHPKSDALH